MPNGDPSEMIARRQASRANVEAQERRAAAGQVAELIGAELPIAVDRLERAGFPENKYFAWALDRKGRRRAVWCFAVDERSVWAGIVVGKGGGKLVLLSGNSVDRFNEKLEIRGMFDLAGDAGALWIPTLYGILSFLRGVASDPAGHAWGE